MLYRALTITLLLSSCVPNLTLQDDTFISCAEGTCPSGWHCSPAFQRCIRDTSGELRIPVLLDSAATPAFVRRDATVSVRLTSEEAFGAPPTAMLGGRPLAVTLVQGNVAELSYSTAGNEPENVAVAITASFVTTSGAVASDVQVGSVIFDFTPPTIGEIRASSTLLKRAGATELRMTTSDDTTSASLTVAGRALVDPVVDGLERVFSLVVSDADVEGIASAVATVTDRAGNVSTRTQAELLTFDFTPPALLTSPAIQLRPAPGNVLGTVSQATLGTSVDVFVEMAEPVTSPPEVSTPAGPLTLVSAFGTQFLYRFVLQDLNAPQGEQSLLITATDMAGNPCSITTASVPAFFIDTVAPSAPSGMTMTRVMRDTASVAAHVSIAVDAESDETLFIYDKLLPPRVELARGALTAELPLTASSVVYAAVADAAGNLSPLAKVLHVSVAATLTNKIAGDLLSNPHVYRVADTSPRSLDVVSSEVPGGPTGALTAISENGGTWTPVRNPPLVPAPRRRAAMAYDAGRGVSVLFGGENGSCNEGSGALCAFVWELDGVEWSIATTGGPPPQSHHVMTYDSWRGEVLLFGTDGRTWRYDGAWHLAATTGPGARVGAMLSFDSQRGRAVLFGGDGCSEGFGQGCALTWEWDGTRWYQMANSGPRSRWGGVMAYDPLRNKTVLFGGYGNHNSSNDCGEGIECVDTWEWNGALWTRFVRTAGPSAHAEAQALFDPNSGKIVLFGGYRLGGSCDGDASVLCQRTWGYDGTWTLLAASGAAPRANGVAVYDGVNTRTHVLFGDTTPSAAATLTNVAMAWQNNSWHGLFDFIMTPTPAGRANTAMTMLPDGALLFGGAGPTGSNDTWRIHPSGPTVFASVSPATQPSVRQYARLAYDGSKAVLAGGLRISMTSSCCPPIQFPVFNFEPTCEWASNNWTCFSDTGALPRQQPSLAFVPGTGVLMYGGTRASGGNCGEGTGTVCSRLWKYNGAGAWQWLSTITMPSARANAAMAYEPQADALIVVGGFSSVGTQAADAWLVPLDGSAMNQLFVEGSITWGAATLFWDEVIEQMVLYDGTATWLLRGDTFRRLKAPSPPAHYNAMVAWDAASARGVLFGGGSGFNDVWTWDGGAGDRPSHLCTVSLASEGFVAGDSLHALDVVWCISVTDTGARTGVELALWSGTAFQPLTTTDVNGCLTATLTDAQLLRQAILGGDRLTLRAQPTFASGAEHVTLQSSYAEIVGRFSHQP